MKRLRLCLLSFLALSLIGCASYTIPLRRDDFGLNFVPVKINGKNGLFLVDSGASHTVIDDHFAQESVASLSSSNLRLAWLGTSNTKTREGIIDEIQIGDYRQMGPYRAFVLSLDAINNAPARLRTIRMDGILGADFFITHQAKIDYSSNRLYFSAAPKGTSAFPPPRR